MTRTRVDARVSQRIDVVFERAVRWRRKGLISLSAHKVSQHAMEVL